MEKDNRMRYAGRKVAHSKVLRMVFVALGILCAGLGAVGVVLPVLPTTPFLLAAAFCFAKSSDKLNSWLRSTRLYRTHLETMSRGEGMTRPAKKRVMASVTVVMAAAGAFMLHAYLANGARGALVGCIAVAVAWVAHIIAFRFIIKTCPEGRIGKITEGNETPAYDAE